MNAWTNSATVAGILGSLRGDVGDIEFGFRAQGLFAHVLARIGASVLNVNHQGHPDIVVLLNQQILKVEVEVASSTKRSHEIKKDDVDAIKPTERDQQGYLAVLDCAEPVRWAPIEYSRLYSRLGTHPLAILHALADRHLARQCNDAFAEFVLSNAERLPALTFPLLCRRILRQDE